MRVLRLVAIIVALAVVAALVWNERHLAVGMAALDEVRAALLTAGPRIDPAADGRPLRVSGDIAPREPLRDPDFAVEAAAVRLDREAQTYQWRERREGSGDNKTLRYEAVWSERWIDSERFERRTDHVNPPRLPVQPRSFAAPDPMLAPYRLSESVITALPVGARLQPADLGPRDALGRRFTPTFDWLVSGDPAVPRVGDTRVRFVYVPHGAYTVIAAQAGDRLVPWRAASGAEVLLAAPGNVPAAELLRLTAGDRWRAAWRVRLFGAVALVVLGIITTPTWRGLTGSATPARTLAVFAAMGGFGLAAVACAVGWLAARAPSW